MMRWAMLVCLTGCSMITPATEMRTPPFQDCQPLPRALPRIREPEAINERLDRVEALYRDCAARLRMTVSAWPKEGK